MDQGRRNNQRMVNHGLPPRSSPRKVNNTEISQPISKMSSSTISLAPKNPTSTSYGNSSKPRFPPPNHRPEALPSSTWAKNDYDKGKIPLYPSPQPNEYMILGHEPENNNSGNPNEAQSHARIRSGGIDPKVYEERKLRRQISNKKSQMRATVKKFEHKMNLEKQERILEVKLAVLRPQVAMKEKEHEVLLMENKRLNQHIADRINEKMMRDVLIEENQNNVIRLRQLVLICRQELQQLWNIQSARENGLEGVRNLSSNQSGSYGETLEERTNRCNQHVEINQPVGYGGIPGGEAYNPPGLPNNNTGVLQMQKAPSLDQFGMVQMPNPNSNRPDAEPRA